MDFSLRVRKGRNSDSVKRIWTLEEARSVLDQVDSWTREARNRFSELQSQLSSSIIPENKLEELEEEREKITARWVRRIMELGAEVKGLWLVDFDNGQGYYCWQLGEEDIMFEHGYNDGFAGRRPLEF